MASKAAIRRGMGGKKGINPSTGAHYKSDRPHAPDFGDDPEKRGGIDRRTVNPNQDWEAYYRKNRSAIQKRRRSGGRKPSKSGGKGKASRKSGRRASSSSDIVKELNLK